jgi:hypothetical protein
MLLGSAARLAMLEGEKLMEELDGDGAFADRRGDTLHPAVANVAGREHAWHARLEEKRAAIEGPRATVRDICPREDEPLLIPFDVRRKPISVRLGSDQEEERARLDHGFCLRPDVAQYQVL